MGSESHDIKITPFLAIKYIGSLALLGFSIAMVIALIFTGNTRVANEATNEDLRELEMMHCRLSECLMNYERIQSGGAKMPCPLEGGEVWGANKWVTRYVDYTSKYGLGFLLNDGSSGVYFNDSTKAVHSVTTDEFVYIERRRAGADGTIKEP